MFTVEEKMEYVTGKGMWHTRDMGGKKAAIHLADGPHGLRAQEEGKRMNNDSFLATCFPTASALACSFDEELVADVARAISEEAKENGVSVVLGPGINIKRSPLCGRNFEYFSEDPLVAGRLSTAYVKAMQENGSGTSLKHFAGNSQETHRMTMNAQIDERALREIYLLAFEQCVKEAKPATIMASYNRLNGLPACENSHLLTEILREEWGYDGCVISDWGACVDLPACVEAGMDLEMPDSHGNHLKEMKRALEGGSLSEAALNRAVSNIETLVESYPTPKVRRDPKGWEKRHRIAKRAAMESAVLLHNDGSLPLARKEKLLVIGALAKETRMQGGGSSHIHTRNVLCVVEALEAFGIDVCYAKGYEADNERINEPLEAEAIEKAKQAVKEGRTLLFCGGLTDFTEGEGYDRSDDHMPVNQCHLLRQLTMLGGSIVFLSFGGAPYRMDEVSGVNAILQMYLGGEAVNEAAVDLLFGVANPCGKLAETWPLVVEDTPCYEHFARRAKKIEDVEYRESIYVGYRYYDTFEIPVRYPFGYGLSYTTFSYQKLGVKVLGKNAFAVSVTITNTGDVFGKEIVQLYVQNPESNNLRARRELRGFVKVALAPGESKDVVLELSERAFCVFDSDKNCFQVVGGSYFIQIGSSIQEIQLQQEIEVSGEYELPDVRQKLPSYFPTKGEKLAPSRDDFVKLYGRELSDFTTPRKGCYSMKSSLRMLKDTGCRARFLFWFANFYARMMTRGKSKEDPEVMMMVEGICDGNVATVVNQSDGMISYRLVEKIVEHANR